MRMKTSTPGVVLLSVLAPLALSACVSRSDYHALQTQNQQLQTQNQQLRQQLSESTTHVGRLQNAVKYTVNSDLLFPSGGWQISQRGKTIITRLAQKLAPRGGVLVLC